MLKKVKQCNNSKIFQISFFNKILNLVGSGIVVTAGNEKIAYLNNEAAKLMGLKKSEILGKPIFNFFTKDSQKIIKKEVITKRKIGKRSSYEAQIQTKNVKKLPVYITGIPLSKWKKYVGSVGVITDISKLKQTEIKLRKSVDFTKHVINTMGEGLIAIDKNQRLFFTNKQFAKTLGYTKEELLGKHWTTWFPKEEIPKIKKLALERRKKWQSSTYEAKYLAKDGRKIPMLTSGTPLAKKGEPYKGSIGVITNITKQKETKAKLKESYKKLKKLNQLQLDFLANASHQLRTPITIIKGNAEMILKQKNASIKECRESLTTVAEEADKMSKIINDMMLLVRAKQGMQDLKLEKHRLDSIVKHLVKHLNSASKHTKIKIKKLPPVTVNIDKEKIEQIFLNLLENAQKYTDKKKNKIWVWIENKDKFTNLKVKDSGIGITKKEIPMIFDRFYRTQIACKKSSGSGLGLSISKWTAEAHGGKILVKSAYKKGSEFTLRLPKI